MEEVLCGEESEGGVGLLDLYAFLDSFGKQGIRLPLMMWSYQSNSFNFLGTIFGWRPNFISKRLSLISRIHGLAGFKIIFGGSDFLGRFLR